MKIRVLIEVRGGNIQTILSNIGMEVTVVDWDNPSINDEALDLIINDEKLNDLIKRYQKEMEA